MYTRKGGFWLVESTVSVPGWKAVALLLVVVIKQFVDVKWQY
jgi:hypothetical protein